MKQSNILKNIVMLYGFSIAKIVFPLITLPYLTRVLSVEKYGVVAYVKSIMTYMQLLIDFGFMLSGTKEIVQKKENIKELYNAIGDILIARIILCAVSFLVLLVLTIVLPILRKNFIYTFLTFIPIVMTVFLFDYVFRGLEKMQIISSRFILMKGFSTAVTFFLVKSDADLMVIPILEIIGSSLAIILVYYELKKYKLCICFSGIISAITKLKISAVYFASNIATTVGGALSTVLIGAFMNSSDIAYWSAALQLLNAVLAMYNPIVDGIYPSVIQSHDYRIIKKIAVIFMPLIICGCMIILFCSDWIVTLIYGEEYFNSAMILRGLIPVFIFAFPAQLIGWPMLGTIGKTKYVTISTIIYGIFNVLGLIFLYNVKDFNLRNIVILRSLSEFVLFFVRFCFCLKYKTEFKRKSLNSV